MGDGLVVADSDLIIDFLRGRGPGADAIRRWLREGRLRMTAVTAFDLRLGMDFLDRAERIGVLLARRTLPLDTRAALHAGEVFVARRQAGRDIGVKDCLQAGICLRFDLPLATRNIRHFDRIPALRLAPLE